MNTSAAAADFRSTNAELGMWVFLATEVLFFSVLFFGYLITRLHHPAAFAAASRHTDVVIGTVNTAILLTSSLTMALAVRAAKDGTVRRSRLLLGATFVLGAAFFALKMLEYVHDFREHLVPWSGFTFYGPSFEGARLFFLLYFVMTGAHAIHLLVGLALVAGMMVVVARRRAAIDIVGLYWHLIDIVWIFLYPLLYLVSRA